MTQQGQQLSANFPKQYKQIMQNMNNNKIKSFY